MLPSASDTIPNIAGARSSVERGEMLVQMSDTTHCTAAFIRCCCVLSIFLTEAETCDLAMSGKGDVVLVVHMSGRHYVLRDLDMVRLHPERVAQVIVSTDARWSRTRAAALVLEYRAIDNAIHSKNGVRELFVGTTTRGKKRSSDDAMIDDLAYEGE